MANTIQVLELVDEAGNRIDFVCKRIETLFDKNDGITDEPHRHNYFTIILVKDGSGTHTIDFKNFEINNSSLHVIYPGQVHSFVTPDRPSGWVFNFTSSFLASQQINNDLVNKVYLYNSYGDTPPLHINNDQFIVFEQLAQQIIDYYQKENEYKLDALGALLKLFFINSANLSCNIYQNKPPNNLVENNLLIRFKKLVDQLYSEEHKVAYYSNELSVTSDYLNKYVKSQIGKSAKELIQDKILLEAKRSLIFSNISNKELSYQLGFDEPSHFSNFFKKFTQTTPKNFKLENAVQS